jgi:hypothetical protein
MIKLGAVGKFFFQGSSLYNFFLNAQPAGLHAETEKSERKGD